MKNTSKTEPPEEKIGVLNALPFLICLLGIISIQRSQGVSIEDNGSIFYQLAYGVAYVFALFLILKKLPESIVLFKNYWMYLGFLFYALSSVFWSQFPLKVVVQWLHYVGSTLVCIAMLLVVLNRKKALENTFLIFATLIIPTSLFVVFFVPSIGISTADGARWVGLAGNPNTLGIVALLSVWACIIVLLNEGAIWKKTLAGTLLLLSFVCLIGSNSVTSTVLSVFIVMSIVLISIFKSGNLESSLIKLIVLFFVAILGIFLIYLILPEMLSEKWFFESVGRSETFTGRLVLWEMAEKAIGQKPLMGWGFDGLKSMSTAFDLKFTQLHNGYYDIIVRGGYLALGFIVFFSIKMIFHLFRIWRFDKYTVAKILPLVIAIYLHNVTEASFMRSPHDLWLMFIFLYMYLHSIREDNNALSRNRQTVV
ncbi:MAG: O-antigen ligase family protein [Gammaproteobacteria bacterium]|nr:O-antigen ligase family protein [Gammaproteobacteria bacterium]